MSKFLPILTIFVLISTISAKIYSKCEFAQELYQKYRLEKKDIGYHMCVARIFAKYNTQYKEGEFVGIYRIGTQWWCGQNETGGICNIRCSDLVDDDLADDVECAKEVIRIHGFSTWKINNEKCREDFSDVEMCLKNEPIHIPNDNFENNNSINTCGRPFQNRGAIIGGSVLSQSQRSLYPWIAALIYSNNDYFCGGVLISKNKVLTASHCILNKGSKQQTLPKDIRVILGVYNLNDQFEIGRSVMPVEKIRMHPDWNPNTERYDADIAVLYLELDVQFSRFIQPICLLQQNTNVQAFNEGIVVGYGIGSETSTTNENIPKIINLPIHKNEDCFLHNKEFARISSKNTFCAGTGSGSGVCIGDSGSGLYIKYEETYYLRGIVSASFFTAEKTCNVNDYAIFTSVNDYYNFIVGS